MTFLGHRHVKLFIYAKKEIIPSANSPLQPRFCLLHDCVGICVLVSVFVLSSGDVVAVISKVYDTGSRQLFSCLRAHLSVYVSVSGYFLHVTDMGHP